MSTNLILHRDSSDDNAWITLWPDAWADASVTRPIDCVVADPPYGIGFKSFRATTPQGLRYTRRIDGDADMEGAVTLFQSVMDNCLPLTAPQADLYVFTKWEIVDIWMDQVRALDRHGFKYKMMLVWDKGVPGQGDIDGNWGCGHELILYCKKGRRDVPFRRSAIIHVDKLGSRGHIHPTEKPARLIEKLLEMSTKPGDLVVDPFSGSGSTAVAAQNLGRDSISFEIDPQYHQDSLKRLDQSVLL